MQIVSRRLWAMENHDLSMMFPATKPRSSSFQSHLITRGSYLFEPTRMISGTKIWMWLENQWTYSIDSPITSLEYFLGILSSSNSLNIPLIFHQFPLLYWDTYFIEYFHWFPYYPYTIKFLHIPLLWWSISHKHLPSTHGIEDGVLILVADSQVRVVHVAPLLDAAHFLFGYPLVV